MEKLVLTWKNLLMKCQDGNKDYEDIKRVLDGVHDQIYPTFSHNKISLFHDLMVLLDELADRRDKAKKPFEIDMWNRIIVDGNNIFIASEGVKRHG
jgi:hypothetical protein